MVDGARFNGPNRPPTFHPRPLLLLVGCVSWNVCVCELLLLLLPLLLPSTDTIGK